MKRSTFYIGFFILILFTVSCVSGKKFSSLEDTSKQFMKERDEFKSDNIGLEMQNKEYKVKIDELQKKISTSEQEIADARDERDKAVSDYSRISAKYTEMQNAQEDLIKGNVKETSKLLTELQLAQSNLQKKEDLLRSLEQNLDTKKTALDAMNFELEKKNSRLAELEKILDAQKKVAMDLKNKVSEALLGYENNGLTVTNKNGKVYVSLDEKLLFKSGSWDIDANGKNALKKLAGVLEKNQDIQIMIEGHTDNVPYNPGNSQLKDNWDLSVKRATTVIRVLLDGSTIDPSRLTASGRSQFQPVDQKNTADARTKNRRTEIILTPDLSELYQLINKY
jgi:chemotaxis protein MotB